VDVLDRHNLIVCSFHTLCANSAQKETISESRFHVKKPEQFIVKD
jgi:hypothetical protein